MIYYIELSEEEESGSGEVGQREDNKDLHDPSALVL